MSPSDMSDTDIIQENSLVVKSPNPRDLLRGKRRKAPVRTSFRQAHRSQNAQIGGGYPDSLMYLTELL